MPEIQRDSFVFYRSFFEALLGMNKTSQADCLMALADYALNGTEPKPTPEVRMFFTLVKPQIDANRKRFENGCKGGRPKPNNNQTETKQKPNANQITTKTKPNVNDNDNVNDNNIKDTSAYKALKSWGGLGNADKVKITQQFNIFEVEHPQLKQMLELYGEKIAIDIQTWLRRTKRGQFVEKDFIMSLFYKFYERENQ